ncbi:hypothetical protein GCM10009555_091820 [Acrocarpospora macrocephala]|uniref:Protein NO VEIN C-terminal domain-containing protein n=2 Tax=Acrocarpospora macrocephala TaxID=150177 RepID=A0A5M3X9G9_9ACTN|nr:hypothetical protein Amac_104170 [Acrocarpospora macrocephala]
MVHVGQNTAVQDNLAFGLETRSWGFPSRFEGYSGTTMDFVILGTGASPRVHLEAWLRDTIDLYVCQAVGNMYEGTAPHWPDEVDEHRIKYPTRFGIEPLARLTNVSLGPTGPLPEAASDAIRRSGIDRGLGKPVRFDPEKLFKLMDVTPKLASDDSAPVVPLSQTRPVSLPTRPKPSRNARRGTGAGRQIDPRKREAIERHAVELATEYYERAGWTVEEVGKPYDLRLTMPGVERRVEVKGTTGAPTSVELTFNEVQHAREFPAVDLFVVSDITVAGATPALTTSGGIVTLVPDWEPADEDLRPTRFEYRIPS